MPLLYVASGYMPQLQDTGMTRASGRVYVAAAGRVVRGCVCQHPLMVRSVGKIGNVPSEEKQILMWP